MSESASAYLVLRVDNEYREEYPLNPDRLYSVGRATTNHIVLKDDMCSREHAEIYYAEGHWRVRDLKSLNGTHINGTPLLGGDRQLSNKDEIHAGCSRLLFIQNSEDLPDLAPVSDAPERIVMRRHAGYTLFTEPGSPTIHGNLAKANTLIQISPQDLGNEFRHLFRLAVDMSSANDRDTLVQTTLDGLLEATPADTGAVLSVVDENQLVLLDHRHRDLQHALPYLPVSQHVSQQVLQSKEALLAVVDEDSPLYQSSSLVRIGVTSLLCAPVMFQDKVLALIHLYCTSKDTALNEQNLEFAAAVAMHLGAALHQMNRQLSLTEENRSLRDQLRIESEMIGSSPAIKAIESQIALVADSDATVLIRGESGSGKELVARAIHYSSPRKDGPFVSLNCAALTKDLVESELFGHEKGSFTGATDRRIGKFEDADHGTLFLDEIGEMDLATQAKLLRVLEGHPFQRVGGNTAVKVDVRLVSATNLPLEKAVVAGQFRKDLFYRLDVVGFYLPPLRDRKEDVPLLAEHFLRHLVAKTGRRIRGFTPAAVHKMQEYDWPGNVRELRNVVERAVVLGRRPIIDAPEIWLSSQEAIPPEAVPPIADGPPTGGHTPHQPHSLEEAERQCIAQALEHTDWNKLPAAAILGIDRSTLDRKIKAHQLTHSPKKSAEPQQDSHHLGHASDPILDEARQELAKYLKALEDNGWKRGLAARQLRVHRQKIPRNVAQIFNKHPQLRAEPEWQRLVREFCKRVAPE